MSGIEIPLFCWLHDRLFRVEHQTSPENRRATDAPMLVATNDNGVCLPYPLAIPKMQSGVIGGA